MFKLQLSVSIQLMVFLFMTPLHAQEESPATIMNNTAKAEDALGRGENNGSGELQEALQELVFDGAITISAGDFVGWDEESQSAYNQFLNSKFYPRILSDKVIDSTTLYYMTLSTTGIRSYGFFPEQHIEEHRASLPHYQKMIDYGASINDPEGLMMKANLLFAQGDTESAKVYFERARSAGVRANDYGYSEVLYAESGGASLTTHLFDEVSKDNFEPIWEYIMAYPHSYDYLLQLANQSNDPFKAKYAILMGLHKANYEFESEDVFTRVLLGTVNNSVKHLKKLGKSVAPDVLSTYQKRYADLYLVAGPVKFRKPSYIAKATKLYEQSLANGNEESILPLAKLTIFSRVKPDRYMWAKEQFKEALQAGNYDASIFLGYMHELGIGVPKDTTQAEQYYLQAINTPNHDEGILGLSRVNPESLRQFLPERIDASLEQIDQIIRNYPKKIKIVILAHDGVSDHSSYLPFDTTYYQSLLDASKMQAMYSDVEFWIVGASRYPFDLRLMDYQNFHFNVTNRQTFDEYYIYSSPEEFRPLFYNHLQPNESIAASHPRYYSKAGVSAKLPQVYIFFENNPGEPLNLASTSILENIQKYNPSKRLQSN